MLLYKHLDGVLAPVYNQNKYSVLVVQINVLSLFQIKLDLKCVRLDLEALL